MLFLLCSLLSLQSSPTGARQLRSADGASTPWDNDDRLNVLQQLPVMQTDAAPAASLGVCDVTQPHTGDCEAGDQGMWPLNASVTNWQSGMRLCRASCQQCARCNFISVSLQENECNWFHDCDLSDLTSTGSHAEWRSQKVRGVRKNKARVKVHSVRLQRYSIVPWRRSPSVATASDSSPAQQLYIVDHASAKWIRRENRGEGLVKLVFRRLASECQKSRRLIIDIGANAGYYGLISATLGCQVAAFEPQPGCQKAIEAAIAYNNFSRSMRLLKHAVGPPPSVEVQVPAFGCAMTGTTRSPQLAAGRNPKLATTRTTTVIDALSSTELGMSVLLVKVDVEGAEIHVLQALQPMLSSIENLVVETSPGWWTEGTT